MADQTFGEYEREMRAQGFDAVLERDWPPLTQVDTHTHPFAAQALVVRGEMWLTQNDATRHIAAGGTFELAAGVPHAERYGAEGATYWVARRGA
jgi:hypothetical protein